MESSMGEEPGKCVTNEAERTRAQEMVVKTATRTHNNTQQFCGNFFIRPIISWSRGPWGKGGTGNDHKDMVARTTMCMRMG